MIFVFLIKVIKIEMKKREEEENKE